MNENEPIDVDALRDQFLDKIFDEYVFTLDAEKLVQYAKSCGETEPQSPERLLQPLAIGLALSMLPRSRKP